MKEIEMLSALCLAASRRFPLCFLLLISLLSSAAVSLAQSAIVVPNAGFETPNIGSGGYPYNPTGGSWSFSGSSGISGSYSPLTSGNPAPPEGSQVAFVQQTGSVSQTLNGFQAGTTYALTVAAAQRGNYGTETEAIQVSVDGTVLGTFTPSGTSYADYSFNYTPQTGGSHTLQFLGVDPSGADYMALIDNVRFLVAPNVPPSSPTQVLAINAGFETPNIGSGNSAYTYTPSGASWTFANGGGISGNASDFTFQNSSAPEGSQVAFIQNTGSISQSLSGFQVGTTYTLTVAAAQRVAYSGGTQVVQVSMDGTALSTLTPSGAGYSDYTFSYTPQTSGPHTLQFLGLNPSGGDNTIFLDNVRFSAATTALSSVGEVHFSPRSGLASRMVGGKFQGSSDGSAYTDLYTIASQPADGQWTTATLTTDLKSYRYLRYLAPDGDYGNIAELAFYTGTGASAVKLTGTPFGTPGSWQNQGNDFTKVFDGDTTTFFDAPEPGNGDFVGIDQGAAVTSPASPTPYGGAPVTIASSGITKIEAENYDLGGEGVAYHDVDNGGQTSYRTDNIGVYPVANASNGYCVGSTAGGEWDGYTLNVAAAGVYTLSAAVGSPTSGGTFHLEFGPVGQVGGAGVIQSSEFTVPNTGSYGTFQTVSVSGVSLPAGPLWMRLVLDSAYPCTFDYFTLSPASTVPSAPTGLTATPGNGSVSLSWTTPAGTVTSYNVKRSTTSGGPYTTISTAGAVMTTNYTDSTVVNGTTYYYVVSAVNAGSESGNSNEASATPILPASDFSVTASPSNFGLATSGTASTTLTLSPVGTFSGNVTLTVSGLPSNILATFNAASPVAVPTGTVTADTLTLTTNGASPGPYPLMLTATCGTFTHTIPLTLTVVPVQYTSGVRLTDLFLTNSALTNRIDWDPYVGDNTLESYLWTRNNGDGITLGTDPFLIDSTGLAYGTTYTYRITAHTYYYVTDPYTHQSTKQYVDVPIGTCSVTDLNSLAVDDQAVDSRLDPRIDPHINTNTFLNHNFGTTSYRGGLFAGYNSDPARVGRSLIKFALPALPSGQHPWRVGSVYAYATRGFTPGTSTTTLVACQRVSDTWTGSTATWSLAPGMSNATNGVTITYDGIHPINTWEHWTLFSDLDSALISNGGILSVGLFSTDEGISSWTYFAKKEYDPALTPFVLYAYGAPN